MPDTFSVEFEVSDDLAARFARALLNDPDHYREIAPHFARGPLFLMVFLLGATLVTLWPWMNIPLAAALVLAFWMGYRWLLRYLIYKAGVWSALSPFQGLTQRNLQVTFGEDRVTMVSPVLTSSAPWTDIGEIVILPDFWLLRLRAGGHFGIPVAVLTPDLQNLIRRKAGEVGASIRG